MTIQELLTHAVTTKAFYCEEGLFGRLPCLLSETFPQSEEKPTPILVADGNTWEAGGREIAEAFTRDAAWSEPESYLFPGKKAFKAKYEYIAELRDWLSSRDGLVIAVGSGSINDLCKRACAELERPYVVAATAASMDGYCSQGAAILKDGLKQTLNCPAPVLVVSTPEVLAEAPPDLAASGFADLAAKQCSSLDWIIADRLGAESIDPLTWQMVNEGLEDRLIPADKVGQADKAAVSGLFEGLAATGFALQYYGASRPASGTEHQFSHVLEMEGWEHDGKLPSHGFKVGVGSLASLKMIEGLLDALSELPEQGSAEAAAWLEERVGNYPSPETERAEVRQLLAGSVGLDSILEVMESKRPTPEVLRKRLGRLLEVREGLASALRELKPDFETFRGRLKAAGAPSTARDLGLDSEKVVRTLCSARLIRNRYGGLDLAYELGILESLANGVSRNI